MSFAADAEYRAAVAQLGFDGVASAPEEFARLASRVLALEVRSIRGAPLECAFEFDGHQIQWRIRRFDDERCIATASPQQIVAALRSKFAAVDGFLESVCQRRMLRQELGYRCVGVLPRTAPQADSAVDTPVSGAVRRELLRGRDVVISGESSSGKTWGTLAALFGLRKEASFSWVSMSQDGMGLMGALAAISRSEPPEKARHVVVVDDFQSDPSNGAALLGLLRLGLPCAEWGLTFVVTTWPSGVELARKGLPDAALVEAKGYETVESLLDSADSPGLRSALRSAAGADSLVASLALEHYRLSNELPSRALLGKLATARIVDLAALSDSEIHVLYDIASLGLFDIGLAAPLLTGGRQKHVRSLLSKAHIKSDNDLLRIGHRSQAQLVAEHIQRTLAGRIGVMESPAKVAVSYLRREGDRQIATTLDRIDLMSLAAASGEGSQSLLLLATLWRAVRGLLANIRERQHADPTWGDNTSSIAFAYQILAEMGMQSIAEASVAHLRARWAVRDDEKLPLPLGDRPSERHDFDSIAKAMEEAAAWAGESSEVRLEVDRDEAHRTWALGLLLAVESADSAGENKRVMALRAKAATAQAADGSFYPPSVPWVTARVVLGLSAAGDNVRTSKTVRDACSWLQRPAPRGPYDLGVWHSGTGTWNSDAMTTALVVLSLLEAGVSPEELPVASGLRWLRSNQEEWTRPGQEIDAALALQSILKGGASWQEFAVQLGDLLRWAQTVESWETVHDNTGALQEESSKVPFVAASLIGIVWDVVRNQLEFVFESFIQSGLAEIDVALAKTTAWDHDLEDLQLRLERAGGLIEEQIQDRERILRVASSDGLQTVRQGRDLWIARRERLRLLVKHVGSLRTGLGQEGDLPFEALQEAVRGFEGELRKP